MDAPDRYLVEIVPPQGGWRELQQATARARAAAEEMRAEGKLVRLMRSVFAPEDLTCFFIYEAQSAEAVEDAVRRAALRCQPPIPMGRREAS